MKGRKSSDARRTLKEFDLEAQEEDEGDFADQSSLGNDSTCTRDHDDDDDEDALPLPPRRFEDPLPSLANVSSSVSSANNTEGWNDIAFALEDLFQHLGRCGPSIEFEFDLNGASVQEEEIIFDESLWNGPTSGADSNKDGIPKVPLSIHTTSFVQDNHGVAFNATFHDIAVDIKKQRTADTTAHHSSSPRGHQLPSSQNPSRERSSTTDIPPETTTSKAAEKLDQSLTETPDQSLMANMSVASSADYTNEEVPRPFSEEVPRPFSKSLRSRRSICVLSLLALCLIGTICGVGFAILARNKKADDAKLRGQLVGAEGPNNDTTTIATPSTPTFGLDVATPTPTSTPTKHSGSTTPSPSRRTDAPASSTGTIATTTPPTLAPTPTEMVPPTLSPTQPLPVASGSDSTFSNSTGGSSRIPILLPTYPPFRFLPWQDVAQTIQRTASNFLDYTETTWNLPGTANNNGGWQHDRFWEGQSFATIQLTARSVGIISTIAQLGFETDSWDCWINHYQNFTWDELSLVAPIEIVFVEGTTINNSTATTEDRQSAGTVSTVMIGGRDIQGAMVTLGWNKETWLTLERFQYFFPSSTWRARPFWDDMSAEEQWVATKICYTKELWDKIPLPEWNLGD
jgi:hypothetical protein